MLEGRQITRIRPGSDTGPGISVIIPARNAASTILRTLDSLRSQTHAIWEAVVVNDGSTDDTAAVVTEAAHRDGRIRLFNGPARGVCAVRNQGIDQARFDRLLFLDADDWIASSHMERLNRALEDDPILDAVHCGWARVTPDGRTIEEKYWPEEGDLFPAFARTCAFPIHACLVRRSVVEAAGRLDITLTTCEDWDLWQRIARTGARFGLVRDTLAFYLTAPGTASTQSLTTLSDALRVIDCGHGADKRVAKPHPAHAHGEPPEGRIPARLSFAIWTAGLLLGQDRDGRQALAALNDDHDHGFDPLYAAKCIFRSAILYSGRPPENLLKRWPVLNRGIGELLAAFEALTGSVGLARRASRHLTRMLLMHMGSHLPLTFSDTHAIRVEVTEPFPDVKAPAGVERLCAAVHLEGELLGAVELPVCGGIVSSYVLTDAVAAEFAWPILGRFFQSTVYRSLRFRRESGGTLSAWRGNMRLGVGIPAAPDQPLRPRMEELHDQIGWTVFLQELWGHPDWPGGRFYTPLLIDPLRGRPCTDEERPMVEISRDLPVLMASRKTIEVAVTAGGAGVCLIELATNRNKIKPHRLRMAIIKAVGLELCRICVREGLLGRSLTDSRPLRLRLAEAAAAATDRSIQAQLRPVGATPALSDLVPSDKSVLVLGRCTRFPMGAGALRRSLLPGEVAPLLLEAAVSTGQPIVRLPFPGQKAEFVVCAPDLITGPAAPKRPHPGSPSKNAQLTRTVHFRDRSHFEALFARGPDPWRYTSPYERTKYEHTLLLLPSERPEKTLELGCAEGHFTVQLAPLVGSLLAADISKIALDRARERCRDIRNVDFARFDLGRDPLPGRFNLIVCSEVLYYLGARKALRAFALRVAEALEPGGCFLTAHANLVVDEADRTGFDWDRPFGAKVIGETFAHTPSLRLIKEVQTPLYRVQLFRRDTNRRLFSRPFKPEVIKIPEVGELPPEVAGHVLWKGGKPRRDGSLEPIVTGQMPILIYHRVASSGPETMARYRVTPDSFEEQIEYLHTAGYYSVSLEQWSAAVETKIPLPGRAIVITFDDGYVDFLTHAWPILKRYGFSAMVFLVSEEVGKVNRWDHHYSQGAPLLNWPQIFQLRREGVIFGSHSTHHRPLTVLSTTEVVTEGIRSRLDLEQSLEEPVESFAYPYGDTDPVVQHLIGSCGYNFGLTCRPALCRFSDPLLALPRLEVTGADTLRSFITKLTPVA